MTSETHPTAVQTAEHECSLDETVLAGTQFKNGAPWRTSKTVLCFHCGAVYYLGNWYDKRPAKPVAQAIRERDEAIALLRAVVRDFNEGDLIYRGPRLSPREQFMRVNNVRALLSNFSEEDR